jgi:hypothetical protein
MQKYSLQDIESTFKERSWWALVASLSPAKYLTYFLANKTDVAPNQITLLSVVFSVISGILFFEDHYILGAFSFQVGYILDIVDGSLARVKGMQSQLGAFFDVFTDWPKGSLVMLVLFWHLGRVEILVFIFFLLFLNCLANKYNDALYFNGTESLSKSVDKKSKHSPAFGYISFNEKQEYDCISLNGRV